MIATVSAIVPSNVFCNQNIAAMSGLAPAGSASEIENGAAALTIKLFNTMTLSWTAAVSADAAQIAAHRTNAQCGHTDL